MEEYLQNLRSLRSQINDIEEVAAKRSVEEQSQKTAIETLEKDIFSVASETTHLNAESKELEKKRARICGQIFGKQEKISSLENETSTLSQVEEHSSKLLNLLGDMGPSSEMNLEKMRDTMGMSYKKLMAQVESKKAEYEELKMSYKKLMAQVESKKAEYEEFKARNSELRDENAKSKQLIMELEQKTETFTPALKALDVEALEEENKALLADKARKLEFKSANDKMTELLNVLTRACANVERNTWSN